MHVVVAAERSITVRTFPGPRSKPFLDAVFAKHMAAGLDDSVLEVATANSAKCKRLLKIVSQGSINGVRAHTVGCKAYP